jgi:hypothetical protein
MTEQRPMQRRRFKQTESLDQRLVGQAERLRNEARGTPQSVARDKLIRQAQQLEAASQMQDWLAVASLRVLR